MTHLDLHPTTRLEARNTHHHALRLTTRSEAMTHLSLCLTVRSEAMTHLALRLTVRSEAMTHLAFV